MRIGEFKALSENEIQTRTGFKPQSPEIQRAWQYWAKRADCADLL
jgi:HCOMODA/2-hydroxy-3-carboxy-muconic semialdehyde decarboxylase